jgi:hypothetical protein
MSGPPHIKHAAATPPSPEGHSYPLVRISAFSTCAIVGKSGRSTIPRWSGNMFFEAKLTEGDFSIQWAELVEQYRDLRDVSNCEKQTL